MHKIRTLNAALGRETGTSVFFQELRNTGNSSLLGSMMGQSISSEIEIEILSAREFSLSIASEFDVIMLKSDLQGYDAQVLAGLCDEFWSKLDCAVVEILSAPEVSAEDVEIVMGKLEFYFKVSWKPDGEAIQDLREISDFWLSGTYSQKNLYFIKSQT
jgi:hypothetical protein